MRVLAGQVVLRIRGGGGKVFWEGKISGKQVGQGLLITCCTVIDSVMSTSQ